jgi:hypothetical protein
MRVRNQLAIVVPILVLLFLTQQIVFALIPAVLP